MMENPERDTEVIFSEASKPLYNASNFYSLYYLSQVKGIEELDMSLNFLARNLRESYWRYGVVVVCLELANIGAYNPEMPDWIIEDTEQMTPGAYSMHEVTKDIDDDTMKRLSEDIVALEGYPEDVSDLLYGMPHIVDGVYQSVSFATDHVRKVLRNSKEYTTLYEDQERFLRQAEIIFSDEDNWPPSMAGTWGGERWAAICRFLLEDVDSDIMWVDQCYSIEHNSGNWMDKIEIHDDEKQLLSDIDIEEEFTMDRGKQQALLQDSLDNARNGDMELPVSIAMETGEYPAIRRYSHLV